ncbi:MAG TPA: Uma2 family endonuclease [Chloroflexia bacterium]|nr:Uma2 family endonuclease [Chloroflexia bacterium]
MALQFEKRHFTVEEYYRMGEAGILGEDDRVELLEGEIVHMSPIGIQHIACVNRLNMLFARLLVDRAIVSVQNPVVLSDISVPQPDVTVLRPREDFYGSSYITPADVLLLVEVADSSIGYDRAYKIPLYAKAGVAEVWLVDVQARTVTTYNQPTPSGYKASTQAQGNQALISQTIPNMSVNVSDILG